MHTTQAQPICHTMYRYMLYTYGRHNHTDIAQIIIILIQICAFHPSEHTNIAQGCHMSHTTPPQCRPQTSNNAKTH